LNIGLGCVFLRWLFLGSVLQKKKSVVDKCLHIVSCEAFGGK